MEKAKKKKKGNTLSTALVKARTEEMIAIELADEVQILTNWLHNDVFALAGPSHATRLELYDFIVQETQKKPDSMIFLSEMRELWLDACTIIEQLRQELESLSRVHQDDRDGLIAYYESYIKALKDEMGSSTI